MIRGVNKNIIEIADTGHECFERAILFLRPDSERKDRDFLSRRATEYLSRMRLRPYTAKQRLWLAALKLGGAAAAGATLTAFLLR